MHKLVTDDSCAPCGSVKRAQPDQMPVTSGSPGVCPCNSLRMNLQGCLTGHACNNSVHNKVFLHKGPACLHKDRLGPGHQEENVRASLPSKHA